MELYIEKNIATAGITGDMNCVMTITQENLKADFHNLDMRGNCACPFARGCQIWRIKCDCDWCFRHLSTF
jgi:hypothetical protein